jgi:hypothetical protein
MLWDNKIISPGSPPEIGMIIEFFFDERRRNNAYEN